MLRHRGAGLFLLLVFAWAAGLALLFASIGSAEPGKTEAIAGCAIPPTPRATSGDALFAPEFQPFDDISPAQAYVCHDVVWARDLGRWRQQGIDAMRANIVLNGEDLSFWSLTVRYTLGTYSTPSARYLTVRAVSGGSVFDQRRPIGRNADGSIRYEPLQSKRISVGPYPADLVLERGSAAVTWQQNGLRLLAQFQTDQDFGLTDVLPLLRSIR